MKTHLASSLCLLLGSCAASGLEPLVLDGPELHPSLETRRIEEVTRLHVPRAVLRDNPLLSDDRAFVEAIAHSASQGQLDGEGVRAALYALYLGQNELGFYGLEAASPAEADRLEGLLRGIWAKNVRVERARVHRGGEVLLVVWNDGLPASCWEAVNAGVVARLGAP